MVELEGAARMGGRARALRPGDIQLDGASSASSPSWENMSDFDLASSMLSVENDGAT